MIARHVNPERAVAAAESELSEIVRARANPSAGPKPYADRVELGKQLQQSMLSVTCEVAVTYGDNWKMTEGEAQSIASPMVDVIEMELGTFEGKPWNRLWISVALWFVPRLLTFFFGTGKTSSRDTSTSTTSTTTTENQAAPATETAT